MRAMFSLVLKTVPSALTGDNQKRQSATRIDQPLGAISLQEAESLGALRPVHGLLMWKVVQLDISLRYASSLESVFGTSIYPVCVYVCVRACVLACSSI